VGVGRGDRVAVLAHNGVEFFDVQFACARTGVICVLLNWRLTVSELEYIIGDSAPMVVIHDAEFAESAGELERRCAIGELLMIDGGVPDSPHEAALARPPGRPVDRVALTHDDVVAIMYTSGTTGLPKGAMITHGMNFWNCVNLGIPAGVGPDTPQRAAVVPHRWAQLLLRSRAACGRHGRDHEAVRPG
jgi:fatty-acyl-CoA synthase